VLLWAGLGEAWRKTAVARHGDLFGVSRLIEQAPTQRPTAVLPIPGESNLKELLACTWKKGAKIAALKDSFLKNLEGTVNDNCKEIPDNRETWLEVAHVYTIHTKDPNFHKFYDFLLELEIHDTEISINRAIKYIKDHPLKVQEIADKRSYINAHGVYPRSYSYHHGWTLLQTFVFFMLLYALILLCFSLTYESGPEYAVLVGGPRYARLNGCDEDDNPSTIRQRDREARLQNAEQQAVQAAVLASFNDQQGEYGRAYGHDDYGTNYGDQKYRPPKQSVKPKDKTIDAHSYKCKEAQSDYRHSYPGKNDRKRGLNSSPPMPPNLAYSLEPMRQGVSASEGPVEIHYAFLSHPSLQPPETTGILDAVVARNYSPR